MRSGLFKPVAVGFADLGPSFVASLLVVIKDQFGANGAMSMLFKLGGDSEPVFRLYIEAL